MITVASVWVKANVPYGVEYVTNLRAMVRRHLHQPHRFVCLTNRPSLLPKDIEPIAISHDPRLFGWWAKVQLFDPRHAFGGRILYLDLDTIIVADLDPIVQALSPFAAIPDTSTFQPRSHHRVVKKLNSSVMVWDDDPARLDWIWGRWSPQVADRLWGDQDWIGESMTPDLFPAAWFPRLSGLHGEPPTAEAKVVLCKVPKNAIAADLYPWVGEAWRAA